MRKEILFAIASGILFGLVVAFGIWKANSSVKTSKPEGASSEMTESAENQTQFGLTIAKPEANSVTNEKTITLSGVSIANSWIAISGEQDDYILQTDEKGGFEYEVDLIGGVNELVISAFDENGASVEKKEIVVYSTDFEITKETKAEASPTGEEATTSSDAIRNKVQEKVENLTKSPKAYIGTVTDLSEGTIQINRFVFTPKEEQGGEIQQISINDESVYVKVAKESKTIKFSDLAIGDFIVAMGYVNGNSVLEAKRILVSEPIKLTQRKAYFARVVSADKNKATVKISTNDELTIVPGDEISITTIKEGKQVKIKFADLPEEENIIVVGTLTGSEIEARRIHVLTTESEPPEPSAKASPKSTPTPVE